MDPQTIEIMREQVRAIYRAATGSELVETELPGEATRAPIDEIALRFADLEAMARSMPAVAERVPPFSFEPMVDVSEDEHEWIVEAVLPGLEREDLSVECDGKLLILSGIRRGAAANGRSYLHAEIPRGPFRRALELPQVIETPPRVEVQRGVVSIHVEKPQSPERDRSTAES